MRHIQRGISAVFLIISILAITVAVTAGYFVFSQNLTQKAKSINTFEDCAKLYPVMESYPEQCTTPDGKHFTRQLSEEEKQRLVPPSQPSTSTLQDETTNWKTYINQTYKYQFSYPADWEVVSHTPTSAAYVSAPIIKAHPQCNYENGDFCGSLIISASDSPNPDLKTSLVLENGNGSKVLLDKKIQFAKYPAREIFYFYGSIYNGNNLKGQLSRLILIDHKLNSFIIQYHEDHNAKVVSTPEEWFYRSTVDKILQSFRFLE